MEKKELIFKPIEERTQEQILEDIDKRDMQIQKNISEIFSAWQTLKKDIEKVQNKSKKTDNYVMITCLSGIGICTLILLVLELLK